MYLIKQMFRLNPFGTGQCLSTGRGLLVYELLRCLNPFGTGQCLSTEQRHIVRLFIVSQSLWNRAMSFDVKFGDAVSSAFVSIPLEQGNVFRQLLTQTMNY